MLGDLEQLVLLAVLRAGPDAYGVTLAAEIHRRGGRALTLATVYKTLARLETKGLVRARLGEPTPERGGRAKRFYALTPAGRRALSAALASIHRMADGLDLGLDWR